MLFWQSTRKSVLKINVSQLTFKISPFGKRQQSQKPRSIIFQFFLFSVNLVGGSCQTFFPGNLILRSHQEHQNWSGNEQTSLVLKFFDNIFISILALFYFVKCLSIQSVKCFTISIEIVVSHRSKFMRLDRPWVKFCF